MMMKICKLKKNVGGGQLRKKTAIIVLRNEEPLRSYEHWVSCNQLIKVVPVYKYMGERFTSNLSWSSTHDKLIFKPEYFINTKN